MKQKPIRQKTTTRSIRAADNCEILAPAGQPESVLAAVRCGAHSVYLGMQALNARRSAKNFSADELEESVRLCRLNGVKVYLTLNTVLFDSEIEQFARCVELGCALGVDAFIVQDLGAARLAKQMAPDIALHGSTQMSVHTPAGARLLREWGFKRVVLAREMSLAQIAQVAEQVDIELESFVHGALCVCVSGQCYLSGMLGGRSANRGCCAQPCRLPFSAGKPGECDLSLKDLSAIERVEELVGAGVCSLKIEGRMKRPEYVAAAVTACRDALEGRQPDLETLRAVFARGGFTSDYLDSKPGPAMFGVRGKEDVVAASPKLLRKLENSYQKPAARVGVTLAFRMKKGQPCALSLSDGKLTAQAEGIVAEPALTLPLDEKKLLQSLSKLGGTVFYLNGASFEIDPGLSLPLSELNRMRRAAVEQLCAMRQERMPRAYFPCANAAVQDASRQQLRGYRAEFDHFQQIPIELVDFFDSIALPLDEIVSNWAKVDKLREKLVVCPPRAMFGTEEAVFDALAQCREQGLSDLLASNLAHIQLGQELGMRLHGGFTLNITNTQSIRQLEEFQLEDCVLSPELTLFQMRALGGEMPKGLLVYGHLPLMITRNCPIRGRKGCSACGGNSHLTDRKGLRFEVRCRGGCSEIYNPAPLWMADRLREVDNCSFGVFKFTYESETQVRTVIEKFQQKVKLSDDITRGLYYRGVE